MYTYRLFKLNNNTGKPIFSIKCIPEYDTNGEIKYNSTGATIKVNEVTGISVAFKPTKTTMSAHDHVLIDAVQLEEVIGDRVTPSPFQEPSSSSEFDFSRAISDGKVIEHVSNAFHSSTSGPGDHKWGPNPSVTPLGLANPEPYGDKWVSMSVPYKSYLYLYQLCC